MTRAGAGARAGAGGRRRRARPWLDYGLRLLTCGLFFVTAYFILSQSTFTLRMRNDVPPFVPGLDGPQSVAFVMSAVLSAVPLLAGRRFLGALVVSSFLASGLGGYWWTTIPWDELITESDFPASKAPRLLDYLLVASPVVLVTFYVAASRASVLRADYRNRGAERHEATRAAAASFLAGAAALVVALAMAIGLWAALASGALRSAPPLPVVPSVLAACALLAFAWLAAAGRLRVPGARWRMKKARQPEPDATPRAPNARGRRAQAPEG